MGAVYSSVSRFQFLFAVAVMVAASSFASEIKLKNGMVYKNVTILHRDDRSIEVQMAYGKALFPLTNIESIDGSMVAAAATPAPEVKPAETPAAAAEPVPKASLTPDATPAPAPEPVVVPAPETSSSGAMTAASGTATADATQPATTGTMTTDASQPVQPAVTGTAAEAASQPVQPVSTGTVAAVAPKPHPAVVEVKVPASTGKMDIVLVGIAILSFFWIYSMSKVQRDLSAYRVNPQFWIFATVLAPGIGYLLYLNARKPAIAPQRVVPAPPVRQPARPVVSERPKEIPRPQVDFDFIAGDFHTVLKKDEKDLPGVGNVRTVFGKALLERASDIHIDPSEREYNVRYRIDGTMRPIMNFKQGEGLELISAIKKLAQIVPGENRKAREGRFRGRSGEKEAEFHVYTTSSVSGEKVAIRVQSRKAGLPGLDDLGMPEAMVEKLGHAINSPHGMILVAGPLDSGKTYTVYSTLSHLDSMRLNIMTVESPVEHQLPGATQILVDVEAGDTYEAGLQSLLRQDPDMVFVGEIRDAATAQIACRAALAKHLFFSTMTVPDAPAALEMLLAMGVDRQMLSSTLVALVTQRLVRVLCPACREAYQSAGNELAEVGIDIPSGVTIHRPGGCGKCNYSGYTGRTGIFEMLLFDDAVRQAVAGGMSADDISALARSQGGQSFRAHGAEKVLLGVTSVEEILQATQNS